MLRHDAAHGRRLAQVRRQELQQRHARAPVRTALGAGHAASVGRLLYTFGREHQDEAGGSGALEAHHHQSDPVPLAYNPYRCIDLIQAPTASTSSSLTPSQTRSIAWLKLQCEGTGSTRMHKVVVDQASILHVLFRMDCVQALG